jgi:cation:H+ antiporter
VDHAPPENVRPVNKRAGAAVLSFFTVATIAGTALVFFGHSYSLTAEQVAAGSFAAVIAASLLISWSAEAAQFLISQGLAVAIIALLQVLPEFMIEAVFAYRGDTSNMLANLTGSNRLLMGVGWPLIYVTAMVAHLLKTGKRLGPVVLRPENCVEVWALVAGSGWFLVILWRGVFVLWDGAVLLSIFVGYLLLLAKLPAEEEGKEDLLAPSIVLVELPRTLCIVVISFIMVVGGATMILIANPFVDSMQIVAATWGIREFYFVQWVAPFLTEFPEKVTAFYWAKRVSTAPMALVNMVSSKVNQWTLLAAMIPIVYCCFSPNGLGGPFERVVPVFEHANEVWLSVTMTMYGAACLLKKKFTGVNCSILFALWFIQFVNPAPEHSLVEHLGPIDFTKIDMRETTAWIFAGLAVAELAWHGLRGNLTPLADIRETMRLMREGSRGAETDHHPA